MKYRIENDNLKHNFLDYQKGGKRSQGKENQGKVFWPNGIEPKLQ